MIQNTLRPAFGDLTLEPLVSVILQTYNHEPYIEEALAGIVCQQVDFGVEILICEDCSTDRTRELVVDFERRHPGRVRLFLSKTNQNDNEVFTRAWKVARGRYLTCMDGDDYWTDPLKLQKQVRFLEEHPEVFICAHAVSQIDETGAIIKESKFDIYADEYLSQGDLVSGAGHPMPALSVLFRNNGQIPPYTLFNDVFNSDTFMFAFFGNFGGGFISREIMGVHRVHGGSTWALLSNSVSADYRNVALRRIPSAIKPSLRSAAYLGLLRHSRFEDHRLSRKMRDVPVSILMMLFWLRWRSALYIAPPRIKRVMQAAQRLWNGSDRAP